MCSACQGQFTSVSPACYGCHSDSPNGVTCANCQKNTLLQAVRVATAYQGIAKDLVWKLKFGGTQDAARAMAAQMLPLINKNTQSDLLIVPVPTATTRVRQRGYDQARLLARELAWRTRLPYVDCLARHGQTHQVGANREARLQQLSGAFRVTKGGLVHGAHIILIDDVLTTGATLSGAAEVLMEARAGRVEAVVFARA
ncbi:MAG: competence protein [Candidatus Saccharibacteria bacterium]|nr:competence protein [Candidatus Saccharibacteria bacterium]